MNYLPLWAALLGVCCASAIYAALLHRITHLYYPDYTWLTVVGGNVLIWAFFTGALTDPAAPSPPALLVLVNCAAGLPIIVWQVGLAARRSHGALHARRSSADRRSPRPDRPYR